MMIIAVHKWPEKETIACTKDMIAGFTALLKGEVPKDIVIVNTWQRGDGGAFCADSAAIRQMANAATAKAPDTQKDLRMAVRTLSWVLILSFPRNPDEWMVRLSGRYLRNRAEVHQRTGAWP